MEMLQHLVSGKYSPKLSLQLRSEFRNDSWDKRYSAVVMAAAVAPEIGNDVLVEAVSGDAKRFDLHLYCLAARALAAKQGDAGLRVLLKHIPRSLHDRVAESVVFDLVATYGSAGCVPDLKALVESRPEFAVSAGFAMAGIGGASCKDAISDLLRDKRIADQSETISDGHSSTMESVPALLKKALARCPNKAAK
jgi:hypothetical protein